MDSNNHEEKHEYLDPMNLEYKGVIRLWANYIRELKNEAYQLGSIDGTLLYSYTREGKIELYKMLGNGHMNFHPITNLVFSSSLSKLIPLSAPN